LDDDATVFMVNSVDQFCEIGDQIIAMGTGHLYVSFSGRMYIHMTRDDEANTASC
jgi:ATP-dependent protease HslVU (ClpYQ) peptidase subunit